MSPLINALEKKRKEFNVNKKEFAQIIGISFQYYWMLSTGKYQFHGESKEMNEKVKSVLDVNWEGYFELINKEDKYWSEDRKKDRISNS